MARCGCTPKCNCVFQEGICTKLDIMSSSGGDCASPILTYAIGVRPDNDTVFCGAGGLNTVLNFLDTNTIDLNGTGSAASPLEAHVILTPDANVPDPELLGTGNLIKELPGPGGGIYVSCEDVQDCIGAAIDIAAVDCLNYDDVTNTISIAICGEPNGIECIAAGGDPNCPTGGLAVFPSSDVDNSLTFGTDDRLFAPAAAIVPGDCMVFTGAGTLADPFVITPLVAPEQNGLECVPGQGLLVTPSSDPGNFLVFGGDQRLYVNRCPLAVAASQVLIGNAGPCFELTGGADCVTPLRGVLRISDDVCQGLECRGDGLYVQVDQTELPANVVRTFDFGPFGPFNGANNFPGTQVVAPVCISITNPSPCRNMITSGILSGVAEIGRTQGEFRVGFDISTNGNPGGPWQTVAQVGTGAPEPANRYTGNALWSGDEFITSPGGTRSICTRVVIVTLNGNNARVFAGQTTLTIVGKWAE